MNNITLDNIINFFTFKNIIIFLLVVVVIYLLIKTHKNKNNREDFYTDTVGNDAINNLGKISKSIYNDNTLKIPCNLNVKSTNIIPVGLIAIWQNYDVNGDPIQPLKGWAVCDGNWAWINSEGSVLYNSSYDYNEAKNQGYTQTPNLSGLFDGYVYIIKLTDYIN